MAKTLSWPVLAVVAGCGLLGCDDDGTPVSTPTPPPTEATNLDGTPTATATATVPGGGTPTITPTATEAATPTDTQAQTPTATDRPGDTPTAPPSTTPPGTPTPTIPGTPPRNTAPTAELTAPEDGAEVLQGQAVTFEGLVSDFESAPDELVVTLESDLDGALAELSAGVDGSVEATVFNLSAGTHVVTLTATDPGGLVGEDDLVLTVMAREGAPLIEITGPAQERFQEGDAISFTATASDEEDAADALSVAWISSIDGTFDVSAPAADGSVAVTTSTLSHGIHTITAEVTDTDGNVFSDGITLVVNGAPSTPIITFNPAAPRTDDTLTAEVQVTDDEGDDLEVTYAWAVDGFDADLATASVSADLTTRGQTWEVAVMAIDPDGKSATARASVVIANTPPTATGAVLSPSPALASDTLTCAGQGFADADGDAAAYRYAWTVDGVDVFGASSDTLTSGFDRGQTVVCYATPFDGAASGTRVASNAVTIANANPTVGQVSLSPTAGVTEDTTLTCATSQVRDADGDTVVTSFRWEVGGSIVQGATSATLTGAAFKEGDKVVCIADLSDGAGGTGSGRSNEITVENAVPAVTSIAITPQSPELTDALTCGVVTRDADPADVVAVAYTWTLDDVVVGGATTATLPAGTAVRGQAIRCTATPSDGTATGETAVSDPVTLDNTAPTLATATLTPADPTEASTLTCTPGGYSDPEGDAPVYAYAWTVNGGDIDATGDTLTGADFDRDDVVRCTIVASDGFAAGAPVTSAPVTIGDSAPEITDVHITPGEPTVSSTLTCVAAATDLDGDSVSFTYAWAVDGAPAAGETSETLDPGAFTGGDQVTCTVTPTDGTLTGAPVTSDPVTVGNLAPSDPVVEISPESPLPGQALSAVITTASTDPDGDEVSYAYTWLVDGVPSGYTDSLLPSFHTRDGETWRVEVIATDGSVQSATAADEVDVAEPDADGDGWSLNEDCNDASATVHPGAAEAANSVDDDCDGDVDNRWPVDHPFGRPDIGEVTALAVFDPGVAHIAALDRTHNRVRYARIEDESRLSVDTPDNGASTVGATDLPLAIAVDSEDVPHVAMYDTVSADLVYATRVGDQWLTDTVDAAGDVGARPAIAVDGFGIVHLVYYDRDNDAVKYARGFFGRFEVTTLQARLQAGKFQDIAVDEDGAAHVAWQAGSSSKLRYEKVVDGLGSAEDVLGATGVGSQVRIAVDPVTATVHLAFVETSTNKVEHIEGAAGAWTRATALEGITPSGRIALAVNPGTGAPHVLAYDSGSTNLYHAHAEEGAFTSGVAVAFREPIGVNPSMAIDTDQTLHASFFQADTEDLLYATSTEADDWDFTLYSVEDADQSGTYNDVAVRTDGEPVLYSYSLVRSTSTEQGIYLGKGDGGFLVRAPGSEATNHLYGQVEVEASGTAHMLEWDPTNATLTHLQTADGGASFRSTELATDLFTSNGTSLEVNAAGAVFAAYTDYWGSRPLICGALNPNYTELTLISRAAGALTFSRTAVAYQCAASSNLSLASPTIAATSNSQYLAFYRVSTGDLYYMERTGAGPWSTPLAIDSTNDTGNSPSIAVSPVTGQPAVAHLDRTAGKLRLSTKGAVAWVTVNVADAYASGPVVLRYDQEGFVHLLFRDGTGRRLQYATNRSGSFVTEVVALRGDAIDLGSVAGMELDPDGNPHITFYDAATEDLAYVRGKVFDHAQSP